MEHTEREYIGWKYHIKPKYDHTGPFINGRAYVEKEYRYSFIDTSGKVKVSHSRKREIDTSFQESLLVFSTPKGYGFLDRNGKVVIPAIFGHADRFKQNRSVVMSEEERFGVIDRKGRLLVEYKYRDIKDYSCGLAVFKNNKCGYLDYNGNVAIEEQYTEAEPFREGLAKVLKPGRKHKCFIDFSGEEKFNTIKFECVGGFSNGYAIVRKQNLYGYIDHTGEVVIPLIYINAGPFSQGLAAVKNKDGLYGYINSNGKEVILPKFEEAGRFKKGLARVRYQHGWGLINRSGLFVVDPQFMRIFQVTKSLAAYCVYGGCGYIKLF